MTFNPNLAATEDSGIFGLPYTIHEAKLVLIPVPWEVTTSYGGGTSKGPQIIFEASKQVDLFDVELGNFFEQGIAMLPESVEVLNWNATAKATSDLKKVNQFSDQLNEFVYTETKKYLAQNKCVGVVGGDHSSPFGAIKAFLEKYPRMGILHFDAHADLRNAFEGFQYSHASIMHNVITQTYLPKLVQVGIRDFCEEEFEFITTNQERIKSFFDADLVEKRMHGIHWAQICDEIISHLPQEVYVSFDIDGLDPRFCPNTGTPVPGGLDFNEALYLLKKVVRSGRKIIGFDLNEVSPGENSGEWDGNVGARLLYKLCGLTLFSVT